MKQSIICMLACCFLMSCKKDIHVLGIDLISVFNSAVVTISIDNKEIYAESVQTVSEHGITSGARTKTLLPEGRHTIKITVNDTHSITEQFTSKDDVYIAVYYNEQSGTITLHYQNEPIYYL